MRLISLLTAATLAATLASCGSDSETPSTAQDAAPASSPAAEPETESSEPAAEQPAKAESIQVADVLKFTGTTVDGDQFDGASLAGKPAVLWFWAPWCPTCRGQIPNVSALAEQYDGQVNVVGVAGLSDSDDEIKVFADDTSGVTNLSDSPGEIWQHFGIVEQSVYTVINAEGEVVSEGYLEDDELNDLVAGLVG
jgi:thiol-disulfide isomerase/thioredoxin